MLIHLVSWDKRSELWVKLDSIVGIERTEITSNGVKLWNIFGEDFSILVKDVPREIGKFY